MAVDKVKPLKMESPSTGGTQTDFLPTEANPAQDYAAVKGIAFENSDTRLVDLDANGNIKFTDVAFPSGVLVDDLKEIDPSRKLVAFDDWLCNVSTGNLNWANSTNGAGATTIISAEAELNHPGIVSLSKGTTAAGRASLFLGDRSLILGGGVCTIEFLMRVPLLSTAVQEFDIFVGLGDDASAVEYTDGVYFVYDRNTSVNWQCRTASNAVRTNVISTVIIPTNTWQKFKIVVNANASSVTFFIDNVLVATTTTNIPSGTGRGCAPFLKILGSVGTTARQFDIDYFYFKQIFTTAR